MPTFKEKCPEFGQKINVDGSDEDCIFIRHHDRGGFLVQYRESALLHRSNDEWISVSEEPQWTQITEDESTWPPLDVLVCVDDTVHGNTSYFRKSSINERFIGQYWTHFPKRKKEEKPYMSDESIEQLKREETEARLWELERKADEFDDFIRSQKRKESSPWKSSKNERPKQGAPFIMRGKEIKLNHEYYTYSRVTDNFDEFIKLSRYMDEWMEIPK